MGRIVGAVAMAVVVFLGVARDDCVEHAACRSFLGNDTHDWPFAVPLLIAVGAGAVAFALLTALVRFWQTYAPQRDAVS